MAYTPIFARNTLPSQSTVSGTNPYSNINTNVDTSRITAASNQAADALNPYIKGIADLANTKVNLGNAPDTSRATSINRISGLTSRGVTSGDVANISAMRPENQYEQRIDQGLSRLDEYSRGESTVDRNIANLYLTRLDAAGAASSMAQAQRIASNPYLTTGAKQAAMQETARANASERSKLAGELAVKAQERAYAATKDYSQISLDASRYEEEKYKVDLGTAMENVTNSINGAIAIGNLESSDIQDKINVWQTQTKTMMDDLTRQTNALVASGQLTSDQAALRLDGIKTEIQANQKNIENELYKAKAIAEYESTNENLAISRETLDLNRQKAASDEWFNYANLEQNSYEFEKTFGLSVDEFTQRKNEFEKTYGLSVNEFNQRVNEFEKTFGLSVDEFNQRKNEFRDTFGLSMSEFNQRVNEFTKTYGLNVDELTQRKSEFAATFGLSVEEFNQKKDEFDKQYGLDILQFNQQVNQFEKTYDLSVDQFEQQNEEFRQTFGLSSDEFRQRQYEFDKTYDLNKTETQVKIDQLNATLTSMKLENYKTWNGLATSSVLDYRSRTQGTAADNVDDALANQTIRTSLNNTWQNIPGNEGTTMSEDWARAYYQNIQTSSEAAAQTTKNKINTLKTQWVDTGIIGEEAFNNFTSQMQMVSDFGGNIKMSADGKSVYMVGADGKPLTDSSDVAYSWDINTGARTTVTDTTSGTDITKFNEWKTNNLLSSDTQGYTDTQVFDIYNKIVANGQTPNRTNMMEALRTLPPQTSDVITMPRYTEITDKLINSGAVTNKLIAPDGETGKYIGEPVLNKTEIQELLKFEQANPGSSNYIVDGDLADMVDVSKWDGSVRPSATSGRDQLTGELRQIEEILTRSKGKLFKIGGRDVIVLGLADTGNRTWKIYDVDTGVSEIWTSLKFNRTIKDYNQ